MLLLLINYHYRGVKELQIKSELILEWGILFTEFEKVHSLRQQVVYFHIYIKVFSGNVNPTDLGAGRKADLTNREIFFMPSQSNSQMPDSCSCPGPLLWHCSMTQRDVYARECCHCNTTPEMPQEKIIWKISEREEGPRTDLVKPSSICKRK